MGGLAGDIAGSWAFFSKVTLQFIGSKGESAGGPVKRSNKDISHSVEFAMVCAEVPLALAQW